MSDTTTIKERAVREKRVWVRLTRLCNNGCMFCLDSDSQDGTVVPREEIEEQIVKGREGGGQRLILSGGEATVPPDFVHFVKLGRSLGYDWVQTITNGRMFSYGKFANAALAAGLNEATFSMHGHNAELHDRLVGVKGAFMQSLAGMKNLAGRCVVNVDVVLNRLNIPQLKEILEFWIGLGIHEFDLLHTVPFGRAWNEHRDELFYDPAQMLPHLSRGFGLRHKHKIYMWTNRLPAPYLEGNEDLIQDPHKLHDEVRGRTEMFEKWREQGVAPVCMDDRCPYCAMERFCSALGETLAGLSAGVPGVARVGADQFELYSRFVESGRLGGQATLELAVGSAGQLEPWVEALSSRVGNVSLDGPDLHTLAPALGLSKLSVVTLSGLAAGEQQRVHELVERGVTVRVPAARALATVVDGLEPALARRLVFFLPAHEYLSQAADCDPGIEELTGYWSVKGAGLHGVPICLGGAATGGALTLDLTLLDTGGALDLVKFTDWFIARKYFVKSLRCSDCRHYDNCRGMHINQARNYGFGVLQPVK